MKKLPRDVKGFGFLVSLGQNQRVHAHPVQEKLDENSVYLGSWSSFHQVFTKKHLRDVKTNIMLLKIDCNAGTIYFKRTGWWQVFHMRFLESGITNLLIVTV